MRSGCAEVGYEGSYCTEKSWYNSHRYNGFPDLATLDLKIPWKLKEYSILKDTAALRIILAYAFDILLKTHGKSKNPYITNI